MNNKYYKILTALSFLTLMACGGGKSGSSSNNNSDNNTSSARAADEIETINNSISFDNGTLIETSRPLPTSNHQR